MAKKRRKKFSSRKQAASQKKLSKQTKKASRPLLPIPELKINKTVFWIAIVAILSIAFGYRFVTYSSIVTDGNYYLQGADAYSFVREAENIQNGGFPENDPLMCYPEGRTNQPTLFPYLLAGAGTFLPVEMVSAYSSPILALLSFITVFLLLRELFPKNDYAVIGGTALASLTGIQMYSRSFFGMGDYHVLETLFSFFALFALLRGWNKNSFRWSAAAGGSLLLYTMSWFPASLFITILGGAMLIYAILEKKLPPRFFIHCSIIFSIPVFSVFFVISRYVVVACVGLIAMFWLVFYLRKKFTSGLVRGGIVLATILMLVGVLYLFLPDYINGIWRNIDLILFGGSFEQNVKELEPLLTIYLPVLFSENIVAHGWIQMIAMIIGGIGLVRAIFKKDIVSGIPGLIWIFLTLLHIRFEYYLVVYIGIGGAYVITWFKKVTAQSLLALSFIFFGIVFVLSLYSSQSRQDGQFAHAHFFMAEWINENLPPSGIEESGAYKDNPQPLYGILANWENGYIYTHIGKRAFVTNPGHCNFKIPSEFFMLTDEDDAFEYLKARNIEYVLVDTPNYSRYYYHRTQVNENNLPSLLSVVADNNQFQVVEGEYFETIMSRLYNFDGLGHTSEKSIVVRDNKLFTFDSFARAKEDINKNGGEIYGSDFRNAPIDFPPLEHFELIHSEGEWENGVKLFKVVE